MGVNKDQVEGRVGGLGGDRRRIARPLGRVERRHGLAAVAEGAAEADVDGAEYGRPVIGSVTLQRVRYAAFLQRQTQLPILCSGGRPASAAFTRSMRPSRSITTTPSRTASRTRCSSSGIALLPGFGNERAT